MGIVAVGGGVPSPSEVGSGYRGGLHMALRLPPREEAFIDLFNQDSDNVLAAVRRLQELLDNYHDVDRRV